MVLARSNRRRLPIGTPPLPCPHVALRGAMRRAWNDLRDRSRPCQRGVGRAQNWCQTETPDPMGPALLRRGRTVASGLGLRLRAFRRPAAALGHELIELGLVLGMPQAVEECLEFALFFFEPAQCFVAVLVKGAIAA